MKITKNNADITERTLREHMDALEKKEYSSRELTEAYLDRIDARSELNAFISVCAEQAIAEANAADVRIRKGERLGNFDGIPYAAKDNIAAKGVRLTCASKMLENYISPYDATVISTLRKSGAILLGKTNLDEFAMGTGTESSYFGTTKNPLDTARVAGGSSGGSAAAVAAHLAPFALGSDTGGSVRQPASFCGAVGLRPTYSAISRYGLVGFAPSLDTVGIITDNAKDCVEVLKLISKKDIRDATSHGIDEKCFDRINYSPENIGGKKIAIIREALTVSQSKRINDAISNVAKRLCDLGAEVYEISIPSFESAYASYYAISSAEAATNLARFDGVRYGYRADGAKTLEELYTRSRTEGFGYEVKRRMLFGAVALSEHFRTDILERARMARAMISQELYDALLDADALLLPTVSSHAYVAGKNTNQFFDAHTKDDLLCALASLSGLPAVSLPFAEPDALPLGIQLIGKKFADVELLCMAAALFERSEDEIR